MSTSTTQHQEHPDELLPWFVNQSLTDQEREQVEVHLQSCGRCQAEVELLRGMRAEVKQGVADSPGESGLNRLLAEVQKDKAGSEQISKPMPEWWRTGLAIAASLIIMTQAGLLIDAWYFSKPMVPLAGPQEQGVVLQLSFTPTTTEADIRQIILGVKGTFVGGPGPLGIYRIRLEQAPEDKQGIEQIISGLHQQSLVTHVARD